MTDKPIPAPPDGRAFRQAVLNGEGDPAEALHDYLEEVEPRLHDLLSRVVGTLEPDDFDLLGWLDSTLIALLTTLREEPALFRLKFTGRRGNRVRTLESSLRADAAAFKVAMLTFEGTQQELAIEDVAADTGIDRREIFRRLPRFKVNRSRPRAPKSKN